MVSNLEHHRTPAGIVGAWPAAVREVDALAAQCNEVVQVACLLPGAPPVQALGYAARNLRFEWVPPAGGRGTAGKLDAIASLPGRVRAIERAWQDADAVLVRCPSNVAVAALVLMTLGRGPARRWVKYTGAWRGRPGEKLSYRLQRWWLRSGLTGAAVTVGGVGETPGAATLCNPSLSLAEARAADLATRGKSAAAMWRLLCVGRLVPDKGVDVAIRALAKLRRREIAATLDIAGDGAQRRKLEALAQELGVLGRVRFHGWLAASDLEGLYEHSHVLLGPSRGEGWSRAWTDAAARRCVPIVSSAGDARSLEALGAGVVIESFEPAAWADSVETLLSEPRVWSRAAERGPALARAFTYEQFAEEARLLLGLDAEPPAGELRELA